MVNANDPYWRILVGGWWICGRGESVFILSVHVFDWYQCWLIMVMFDRSLLTLLTLYWLDFLFYQLTVDFPSMSGGLEAVHVCLSCMSCLYIDMLCVYDLYTTRRKSRRLSWLLQSSDLSWGRGWRPKKDASDAESVWWTDLLFIECCTIMVDNDNCSS